MNLTMVYGIDIADADELYRHQVIEQLGVIVLIIKEIGPGGGNPYCCLVGKKEDLFRWFAHDTLGYDFTGSEEEIQEEFGCDFEEFDPKKTGKTIEEIIKGVFI